MKFVVWAYPQIGLLAIVAALWLAVVSVTFFIGFNIQQAIMVVPLLAVFLILMWVVGTLLLCRCAADVWIRWRMWCDAREAAGKSK